MKNYRLVAEIGKGGMADVFLAVAQGPVGFNKLVVIKKMRPELAHDPDALAMFLDEARLAARLSHPNIVQTHEVGHEGDNYFIAMEYLDGKPLHVVRSSSHGGLALPMQLRVIADVLLGLDHAHELRDFDGTPLSVVHRDVSPQNVFITYQGQIKVVDFGIAKAIDSSAETRTGVVKGKVTYMAPEQARGKGVDRRADIFAAGVLLWEAIAGRRMWKGLPEITVVHELLNGTLPSIHSAVANVPPELDRMLALSLAPDPRDRFPTAAAMHAELDAYMERQSERPTARDVGAVLATRFAEDRARVRALIEAELKDVRWAGANARSTGTGLPLIAVPSTPLTPSSPTRIERSATVDVATPAPTNASLALASAPRAPERSRKAIALFAAVGVAGAAAAALTMGTRFGSKSRTDEATSVAVGTSDRAAATAPAPAAAAPSSAAAAEVAPTKVHLHVNVQPNARVFIDGVLLATGPFDGDVPKSAAPHVLRVEADKRAAREEKISLANDLVVEIALTSEPVSGRVAPVRPAVRPPPPPEEPAAAPTGQRPSLEIDRNNPYAKKP